MANILDFGVGPYPYFIRYNLDEFESEDTYYAMDQCAGCLEKSKKSILEYFKNGKKQPKDLIFTLSENVKINFSDGFFNKIILSNVLSAPIHKLWDQEAKRLKLVRLPGHDEYRELATIGDETDKFYCERRVLVDELVRLLAVGGSLKIYTDLIIYGIHSYERIVEELSKDKRLKFLRREEEQEKIDAMNAQKIKSGLLNQFFVAEVLPKSTVLEFIKF